MYYFRNINNEWICEEQPKLLGIFKRPYKRYLVAGAEFAALLKTCMRVFKCFDASTLPIGATIEVSSHVSNMICQTHLWQITYDTDGALRFLLLKHDVQKLFMPLPR